MSDIHLLEQELVLRTIISPAGDLRDEITTVRRFNEYYRLCHVATSLETLASKIEDRTYMIVVDLSLGRLVHLHRYLTVAELKSLCVPHHIPTFNAKMDSLLSSMRAHTCTQHCTQHILVFKASAHPRQCIEPRFITNVLDIPILVMPAVPSESSLGERLRGSQSSIPLDNSAANGSGDLSHLDPPSEDLRSSIITEWQDTLSVANLQRRPCAVCARLQSGDQLETLHAIQIDLTLLRNDFLPPEVRPTDYSFDLYGRAILHPGGMQYTDRLGLLAVCFLCANELSKQRMPKFALCNWLYYGRSALPSNIGRAFKESSIFERVLIARARSTVLSCRFSADSPEPPTHANSRTANSRGNSYRHTMKGMRGNVVITPMDVVRLNECLPPPPETIRDSLCIIFSGLGQQVTRETLQSLYPVLVRKSRVQALIGFLLRCNPHYACTPGFRGFSSEYLNSLFTGVDDLGVPSRVEVACIQENDAIQTAVSGYVPETSPTIPAGTRPADALLMENVGYTMDDRTPLAFDHMKKTAVQRCLDRHPYLNIYKGGNLIPDFNNPYILSWLLPHLDPWGIGGFYHPLRSRYLSMEEQLSHMLQMDDEYFAKDPEFAFIFYNVIRKKNVSHSVRFSTPMYKYRRVIEDILSLDRIRLVQLADKFKNDPLYYPSGDAELSIVKVLKDIGVTAHGIPGSAAQKIGMRNEIRGLMVAYGAPTLFVTLNPSDKDNILVEALSSRDSNIGDLLRGTALGDWQRRLLASRHPSACAIFFDRMIKGYVSIILRHGRDGRGFYGKCRAYYGTVEAQGRGTLHCHLLIWLDGHPSPATLGEILSSSSEYQPRLFTWLETVMSGDFLTDDGPRIGAEAWNRRMEREIRGTGSIHPGALVGPMIRSMDRQSFWNEYYMHLNQLLVEYNLHEHQATCWKYLRRGEAKSDANCRMGMTGEVFSTTTVDPDSMAITVKRTHPWMTHYTDLVTFLMKCNNDVKFVGSGAEAEAFMYYVTDYITKPSLSMHVGLAALSYAIARIEQRLGMPTKGSDSDAPSIPDEALASAMTIAVNSMIGHQEISHQQVMSYLVGGGDRYVSDTFQSFNWGGILNYIDGYWSEALEAAGKETVNLAMRSGQMVISSQRLDYMFRPEISGYESLCLYDFISYVKKATLQTKRSRDAEYQNILTGGDRFSSRDHPQWGTHGLRMRRQACVPVLLGPAVLRTGSVADDERRSMQILVLFKPWRSPSDLKAPDQTWLSALNELVPMMSERHRSLVANLDTLAQSKEQRDRSMYSKREKRIRSRFSAFAGITGDATPGDDFRAMLGVNASVYNTLTSCQTEECIYTEGSCQRLSQLLGPSCARDYDLCYSQPQPAASVPVSSEHTLSSGRSAGATDIDEDIRHITSLRSSHIEAVTERPPQSGPLPLPLAVASSIIPPQVRIEKVSQDFSGVPPTMDSSLQYYADPRWAHVYNIIQQKGLARNPEQTRAFLMVAHHLITGDDQLLMYVGGMGGTGKSHVIKSIVLLFESLGRRRELLIGAPTGIAAVLLEVGAATLHSLVMIGTSKNASISQKLGDIWRAVNYLIIDEISMVGASFLAQLSTRIRAAKGGDPLNGTQPFGGVNVICLGDFCQLKPVNQHALFSSALISNPAFAQARNNDSLDSMSGVFIWRQFKTVVQLIQNQRQKLDPLYASVLANLRLKAWSTPVERSVWNERVYLEYFQQRLLSRVARTNPSQLIAFGDAPVVVGHKILRDAFNVKLIQYHSKRLGVVPNLYHSQDLVAGQGPDDDLQEILWGLPSAKCGEMLGRLPLFVGMKVMITENLAISNGIVNGAEGVVVDIRHHLEAGGRRRIADAVYIRVPGCGVALPGHPDPDVVAIGMASCTVPFNFPAYHPAISVHSFRRRQIPIMPAYSYTDYKSQGRSLERCIVDLATAKGQGVYVMLSRVTSLQGLLILRWFPPTQLFQRPSEELRVELDRLDALSEATANAFGNPFRLLDNLYGSAEGSVDMGPA